MKKQELPTTEDRCLILRTVDGLPPVAAFMSVTSDQRRYLETIKEHFQDLKQALNAYFSGQDSPVGKDDPKRRRLIESEVKYYLRVYELFWFGWSEIQSEVAQRKQSDSNYEAFPTSPGEALAFFLKLDCDTMSHVSVSNSEAFISSHESYNLLKEMPDRLSAKGLQQKRIDRTLRYADEVLERADSGHFLNFCHNAVRKRLRGNPTLRATLKEFDSQNSKRSKELRRILKVEAIQGEKWLNGASQKL